MWSLADPLALLLLPLPLLVRYFWRSGGAGQGGDALVVPAGIGARLARGGAGTGSIGSGPLLPSLAWIALVLALAGPQKLVPDLAAPVSGRELVLALDLSGSMVREDFEIDGKTVSRIDAVRHVATRFVKGRTGDRVALVLFGSTAYFGTPQTWDVNAVARAIDEATIGISGRATAISEALGIAMKRLVPSPATSKVIVLLSDGVNNAGPVRPRDAARLAASHGIRIHTIAMGPKELDENTINRDAVDTATLAAIAELSGGETFRVRTTADLERVATAIDRLETDEDDGPAADLHREYWAWPAGFGLAALVAILLGNVGVIPTIHKIALLAAIAAPAARPTTCGAPIDPSPQAVEGGEIGAAGAMQLPPRSSRRGQGWGTPEGREQYRPPSNTRNRAAHSRAARRPRGDLA